MWSMFRETKQKLWMFEILLILGSARLARLSAGNKSSLLYKAMLFLLIQKICFRSVSDLFRDYLEHQ